MPEKANSLCLVSNLLFMSDCVFQMFTYRFINFEYNTYANRFEPIQMDIHMRFDELRRKYAKPKSKSQREFERIKFGECVVNVPKKSITSLLTSEVLNPFYLFQVFAMALWFYDNYMIYASCIFIISIVGVVASIHESIGNNKKIREMAKYTCEV